MSRAYLQHQKQSDPSWSWKSQFPGIFSNFLSTIDEDVLIKDNTEKYALKLLRESYPEFIGSREEEIFEKYKNVKAVFVFAMSVLSNAHF